MLVVRIKYSDFRAWLTTKKITLETKSKLSKLVPDGTVLWAVDTDLSQAVKIVAEPNGVVVGGQNASNQIILQKLGLSGNSIWQIQVSDGLLTSLLKTPDGGYVVGTSTAPPASSNSAPNTLPRPRSRPISPSPPPLTIAPLVSSPSL